MDTTEQKIDGDRLTIEVSKVNGRLFKLFPVSFRPRTYTFRFQLWKKNSKGIFSSGDSIVLGDYWLIRK